MSSKIENEQRSGDFLIKSKFFFHNRWACRDEMMGSHNISVRPHSSTTKGLTNASEIQWPASANVFKRWKSQGGGQEAQST